ncbi:MAG: AAA family ATPase, partial [Chloroflexi bacterium]|nr:AAA family ATPase [Chloroflexota bacterium]
MFLHHLSLANFRNYLQLELELPGPVVLFQGDNGQGKSNLLEAIYFLATTRPLRAGSDRELVHWRAMEEPIPFARVAGAVRRNSGDLKVEVVIRADRAERQGAVLAEGGVAPGALSKRIKVNGVVKRALDLIGLINVVTFSPQDLELIAGAPALRAA